MLMYDGIFWISPLSVRYAWMSKCRINYHSQSVPASMTDISVSQKENFTKHGTMCCFDVPFTAPDTHQSALQYLPKPHVLVSCSVASWLHFLGQ